MRNFAAGAPSQAPQPPTMNSDPLYKDLIAQPELWKLALLLSPDRLDVALYPPVTREEMIWRSFAFDPAAPDKLRALEDIIYDNPLLLSDFKRVDCIIANAPSIALPPELDEDDATAAYDLAADTSAVEPAAPLELFPTGSSDGAVMAIRQSTAMRSFITRTFYNVRFDCRLAALCRYFTGRAEAPHTPALYAIDADSCLTAIALDSDRRLLLANEFAYTKPVDAAYYILAVMQQLGMPRTDTAVCISTPATADTPESLREILRPHLPQAGALPFPTLRYRASRTTLQAPFSLLIRPICE